MPQLIRALYAPLAAGGIGTVEPNAGATPPV